MLKKAVLAISKSVKSNSAALIIGAAIIIGLNLPRFLSGAESLWYEISGQAARDQELKKKVLQDRTAMTEAWNSFLLANRGNDNPEIKVFRRESGDFVCLDSVAVSDNREDHFADAFIEYLKQNAILCRSDWKYEYLDNDFSSDAGTYGSPTTLRYVKSAGVSDPGCKVPKYLFRQNRYQQHIE
jgi:hypothetical protein